MIKIGAHVKEMGYVDEENKSKIGRTAIDGFADRMGARVYETEESLTIS